MKSHTLTFENLVVARDDAPLSAPISLTLNAGEMLAIHGANGSGKSTLLKMVAGLLPTHEGRILRHSAGAGAPLPSGEVGFPSDAKQRLGNSGEGAVEQADSRPHPDLQPNASRSVWANPTSPAGRGGQPLYLAHQRGLTPSLSVYDNVSFWARAAGHPELTAAAMRYFDLDDIPDVRVETLSAGWQQRAALTRLITQPSGLWLLDEPTANLDAEGIALLQSLMHARLEQGGIILVATHLQMQGPKIRVLQLSGLEQKAEVKAAC